MFSCITYSENALHPSKIYTCKHEEYFDMIILCSCIHPCMFAAWSVLHVPTCRYTLWERQKLVSSFSHLLRKTFSITSLLTGEKGFSILLTRHKSLVINLVRTCKGLDKKGLHLPPSKLSNIILLIWFCLQNRINNNWVKSLMISSTRKTGCKERAFYITYYFHQQNVAASFLLYII